MIVVDTSVWIEFFRGRTTVVARLTQLLDDGVVGLAAPVRLEILSGASPKEFPRLQRLLGALPQLRPSVAVWPRLEAWIARAAARGERFGFGDLLIAGIAQENGATVWSLDGDFARMENLGFVELAR